MLKTVLTSYSVSQSGETSPALAALCIEHAFPAEAIEELRIRASEIMESAKTMLNAARATSDVAVDVETQRLNSQRYQQLVLGYAKCLKDALKSVPNLARYTAALERQMRAVTGRGSVSSRLFVGETLHDVVVEGKRAWATRRDTGNRAEDIGFVQKRGTWYIRLIARRAKSGSGL